MNEPYNIEDLEQKFERLMEHRATIQARRTRPTGKGKQLLFSFMGEYAQWCYEHRILGALSTLAVYLILLSAIVLTLWGFAGSSLGKVFGLDGVRDRITYSYYAILWSSRSATKPEEMPLIPHRFAGTIEKTIGDMLVVTYYDNGQQLRRLVRPANVITTDNAAFVEWSRKYLLKGISIDFYQPLAEVSGHQVWGAVLWYRKNPINVELVEQGIGYPEKNPPTAVVNQIFSQHYWHKARTGR